MIYAEVVTRPDGVLSPKPSKRKGKRKRAVEPQPEPMGVVVQKFVEDLPRLLTSNKDHLGLDIYSDEDLVEAEHREYGAVKYPSDVRVKLMLSCERPDKDQVERTRDRLHTLVEDWFWNNGYEVPEITGTILIYGI